MLKVLPDRDELLLFDSLTLSIDLQLWYVAYYIQTKLFFHFFTNISFFAFFSCVFSSPIKAGLFEDLI